METFKRMTVMILIILVITSLSWSYESGEVLGEADGELQVKGFTHPPDDQDFTWLIDDRHHQFGPHQSDSHSKAVETIEEIILTRIIQTFIYCSMEIRMNPLTTPVALSLLFTQNLINLTLIATLFQITNILMDKLGNNLINGFVENNHYIEPSNIPNVFETGVASNYFSPCANALYETTAINLVPTSIQSFRNHGKLVDHEKSGEGPVANFFNENHWNHENYGPAYFGEKIVSSSSPPSDINIELLLNDLIHSPHNHAQKSEKGNLGFFKGHEGVATQRIHNKNSEFEIGKNPKLNLYSDSSVLIDQWSAIQQVRDSIPNVKLHNDNLDLNLDYDSLAVDDLWSSGEKYFNIDESLSLKRKREHESDFSMEERRKKEGLRILELERLRTKNTKDSSQKFESLEENLGPGSSNLNNQYLVRAVGDLNPRRNNRLNNNIYPNLKENSKIYSDVIRKGKRRKKNSKNLVENFRESGEKTAFLKNENEPTNSYHVVNFKPAQLDDFERDEKVKFIIDIRAESRVMEELECWENNIFKKNPKAINHNYFFSETSSTTEREKLLILEKSYDTDNKNFKAEKFEGKNNKRKRLQDLMMQEEFVYNSIFFEQIVEKVKKIKDVIIKSAFLYFLMPIRKRLEENKTGVFYIPPEDISSFFDCIINLKVDFTKKYEDLLKEVEGNELEIEIFQLPKNLMDWIEHLFKHSKTYQIRNPSSKKAKWFKRISVIADIRKKFLENTLTINKVLGEREEDISNQLKERQERAVEMIDDLLLRINKPLES
ncbi:hypothetical protein BY996DRAFT_6575969 [Phakopsora pachyrhizi]|nr:hypothetical protein BY996DRAFT_6575969 [Phakopsora pachyrhizi]